MARLQRPDRHPEVHDGGNTFGRPVKVADFYDLPACAAFQAGKSRGRACVPEKGGTANSFFRATNYPSGGVNPTQPGQVAVTVGSYINRHSREANGCIPAGFFDDGNNIFVGVKTPGACNKILLTVSNDGGRTFTGTTTDPRELTTVNQDPGQATTDRFWQWAAFTNEGTLVVSYYDRQFGDDEITGFSDVSLSGSRNLIDFGARRVTSSSMPPPTQFDGTFLRDYAGLSVSSEDDAHPVWMDTRHANLFLCPGHGDANIAVCGLNRHGPPTRRSRTIRTPLQPGLKSSSVEKTRTTTGQNGTGNAEQHRRTGDPRASFLS